MGDFLTLLFLVWFLGAKVVHTHTHTQLEKMERMSPSEAELDMTRPNHFSLLNKLKK